MGVPKYVSQEDNWGCAIATVASLLGVSYRDAKRRVARRLPRTDLTEGLNPAQIRKVVAPQLRVSRLRGTIEWDAVRSAVAERDSRAFAALVGIGWRAAAGKHGEFHYGVFVSDSRGGYVLIQTANDFGARATRKTKGGVAISPDYPFRTSTLCAVYHPGDADPSAHLDVTQSQNQER